MKIFFKFARLNNSLMSFIAFLTSVTLIIIGFVLPPRGIIDGSVLIAVGLMLGFYVVDSLPILIKTIQETKTAIHLSHGDTEIEIRSNNNNNGEIN